jgi:hypothetical protein
MPHSYSEGSAEARFVRRWLSSGAPQKTRPKWTAASRCWHPAIQTGRPPRVARYGQRVFAYYYLLTDVYPGFALR